MNSWDFQDASGHELRIVIFTAGPLTPVNRVFFERLAGDPLLDVCGIVLDTYQRPKKPLPARIFTGLRRDGWRWLLFKIRMSGIGLVHKLALFLFEQLHPPRDTEPSYAALEQQTGVPVYRVDDIHSEHRGALIKCLRPQLGVIVGGRILQDSVIRIPEYGTLNIHKRKVPEYRGGGPVGYWEVLAGESSIGVTIHYATAHVDAGPVLAQKTIPIEACDTLESLQIKADIVGAQLYHETIVRFALGFREGIPQDETRGLTYRAPSEYRVWRLQQTLKQKQAQMMPAMCSPLPRTCRTRLLLQYLLLIPHLYRVKKQLIREHRAPLSIFFYHLVSNRPQNHLCMPLEEFVRQVDFLRCYYRVVSLPEAVRRLASGSNDEILAAITFDDGYRDNTWAVEYLRYHGIPAAFFVSVGHVREGRPFDHDRRRGFEEALPMEEKDLARLACKGFVIGSHGLYHEDFGTLDPEVAEQVLRESRRWVARLSGRDPEHFSFPKGQRGRNISRNNFELAQKYYQYVYSAYGGYNFPGWHYRHFLRMGNPPDLIELAMAMDGYTGFRRCLKGDAWSLKSSRVAPYSPYGRPESWQIKEGSR